MTNPPSANDPGENGRLRLRKLEIKMEVSESSTVLTELEPLAH